MPIILSLIVPLIAALILLRGWQAPWRLKLPLYLLRRAAINSALLVEPRRMTAAHLPFEPTAQPRLQSGALLWASAATVTHALAEEADRAAILAAVKPLGFTPEKFLARCPILQEVEQAGLRGCIVRDGHSQRAYFIGAPAQVLSACQRVWEQQERDKTPDDALRLPTGEGLYGLAMAPVENGCIGPLTYLGSLQIAAPAMDPAIVEERLPRGWTLDEGLPDTSGPALHIAPQPEGDNSFTADGPDWLAQLAAGFERSRCECRLLLCLLAVQLTLGLAAMIWQIPAWLVPVAGALLLPCFHRLRPLRLVPRGIIALVWAVLWPLAIGCFVQYAAPGDPALALALVASAACLGTSASTWHISLPGAACIAALAWLALSPALLPAAFCLVAGVIHGLGLRLLASLECS